MNSNLLTSLHLFRFAAMMLLLVLLVRPGAAQLTSGNITGTVYDPSTATVPGANIVAQNVATGVEVSTTTTSAGVYRLENLPIGAYTITVTAPGFVKAETQNVIVSLNQTVTANANLTIGQASTEIEVTEAAAPIDTTTTQIQTTYDSKQLGDLASASTGTGVLNLSLLNAGVTSSGGAGYGAGPSVGGQRPTNNNYTIEGIDNNDLSTTGPVVSIPNDAVAEFTVLQNQFSPDFGHSSGGQFNQVLKTGTNEFHGALYEYFNNRNLNAADNLNAVEGNPLHPRSDTNRFGGNFGGPIKRNKLFFFADYEYSPSGGTSSTAYFAPTAAGYATLSALPGINQTSLAEYRKYLGTAAVAASPTTLPFTGAIEVAPRAGSNESRGTGVFAPGASGAITIPAGEISSSLPSFANSEFAVASIDYNISDKDALRGRFILNRSGSINTSGFPAVFFGINPVNAYLATLSEYHTFTPTLLNEFRLGYNRVSVPRAVFGNQSYPGLDTFPNIIVFELNATYGPSVNAPQYRIQNLYHLNDNLTWTKGNHSFKFGFEGWSAIAPSHFIQRSRGDYEWNYLSDYLYDTNPDVVAQRGVGNATYYQNEQLYGLYANDALKLRPNLTLNIGLRYEYMTVPAGEHLQSLNASASVPGLLVFQTPTAQTTNFMPRIGLAYSPGTSGRTVIRSGFGISDDVLYNNLGINSLPPQLSSTVNRTGLNGTGFLANGGIPPGTTVTPPQGAAARALTSSFIPNQQRPQAYSWNFGIQHQFGSNYVFETRYLGTRGLFLPIQVQLNVQPVVNAANALPVYFSMPSQAVLNSLTSNLKALNSAYTAGGSILPAWAAAGFLSPVTAFMPEGNSTYHGWSNQLTRRFSNGLQLAASYTWSHNIDDSTDAFSSTVLTPRRPENSQNLRLERASSLLDYRNRVVLQAIYDVPYFKNRGWLLKNLIGNWEVAPVYIYQSGQLVTPQSGIDSDLNSDSAPDRVIINPNGNRSLGTTARALTNSAGATVAYLAVNPSAAFVTAPLGTLPNGGRSLLSMNPIDNIDLTLLKRFTVTERFRLEFSARASNLFNHPQYTGGYLNDIASFGPPGQVGGGSGYQQGTTAGTLVRSALIPGTATFEQWNQVVSSNPRLLQLALKLVF